MTWNADHYLMIVESGDVVVGPRETYLDHLGALQAHCYVIKTRLIYAGYPEYYSGLVFSNRSIS